MYLAVRSEIGSSSTSQWSQAECLLGPDGLGAFGEVGEERKEGRALGHPSHITWGIREASFIFQRFTYFKREREGKSARASRGAGAEDKRESQADRAQSAEPNEGLDLTTLRS